MTAFVERNPATHLSSDNHEEIKQKIPPLIFKAQKIVSPPLNEKWVFFPLANLTIKLAQTNILASPSLVLIGDDLSGRLVTLFLWELAWRQREVLNLPPPKGFFLFTRNILDPQLISKKVFNYDEEEKLPHVLIATETIETGFHIQTIIEGIPSKASYTVATLSLYNRPDSYPPEISSHLIWGEIGRLGGPILYQNPANGNQESGEIFPVASKAERRAVVTARKEISTLAEIFLPLLNSRSN